MSETVHYKGIATKIEQPNDKTLIQVAEGILSDRCREMKDYHDNALECLCDVYYEEFFYHEAKQTLYSITKTRYDIEEEIIKAELRADGRINYELKYYNGGAGFGECMEAAFDRLDT